MAKRPFIRKPKRKRHGAAFWDYEYTEGGNLKLSSAPAEDLVKFTRWVARQKGDSPIAKNAAVVDVGCGNGRNLVYLAKEYGMRGTGYDNSTAAIKEAVALSAGLPIEYETRSIAGDLDIPDNSKALALDMMASHFLSGPERRHLRDELHRVLVPGGWLFMKTFLKDGDLHSARLLKDHAAEESGSYVHPVIGVSEHVYGEEELLGFLSEKFNIMKVSRSHKHVLKGKARKRRTISVYLQKDPYH